ncbi:hypothetical protein PR048_027809 [Dryococelus australis]|uniref:Uncharacterized protein n=1 Tax=Dryococelus australis TaxID=614101 RepID=A0ABQ9GHI2_9NEOP|nr:hypothetical protein PR048_027809 [Dryococelus australis]
MHIEYRTTKKSIYYKSLFDLLSCQMRLVRFYPTLAWTTPILVSKLHEIPTVTVREVTYFFARVFKGHGCCNVPANATRLSTHLPPTRIAFDVSAGADPGFSHVGIVLDDVAGRMVFSGISRFLLPLHSGAAPYLPRFILVGSQGHVVTGGSNFPTPRTRSGDVIITSEAIESWFVLTIRTRITKVVPELRNPEWLGQIRKRHQQPMERRRVSALPAECMAVVLGVSEEIWTALNIELLRAYEGEMSHRGPGVLGGSSIGDKDWNVLATGCSPLHIPHDQWYCTSAKPILAVGSVAWPPRSPDLTPLDYCQRPAKFELLFRDVLAVHPFSFNYRLKASFQKLPSIQCLGGWLKTDVHRQKVQIREELIARVLNSHHLYSYLLYGSHPCQFHTAVPLTRLRVEPIALDFHQGEPCSKPGRVTPGFSQAGIVPDDAAGRLLLVHVTIAEHKAYSSKVVAAEQVAGATVIVGCSPCRRREVGARAAIVESAGGVAEAPPPSTYKPREGEAMARAGRQPAGARQTPANHVGARGGAGRRALPAGVIHRWLPPSHRLHLGRRPVQRVARRSEGASGARVSVVLISPALPFLKRAKNIRVGGALDWLLSQRVTNVTPHLAVWQSLLVSLQVCHWLRVIQVVSNESLSSCKGDFSVHFLDIYLVMKSRNFPISTYHSGVAAPFVSAYPLSAKDCSHLNRALFEISLRKMSLCRPADILMGTLNDMGPVKLRETPETGIARDWLLRAAKGFPIGWSASRRVIYQALIIEQRSYILLACGAEVRAEELNSFRETRESLGVRHVPLTGSLFICFRLAYLGHARATVFWRDTRNSTSHALGTHALRI